MNIQRPKVWPILAQLFAATGVIVSLLMVAYEIRQTNAIARVQAHQQLVTAVRDAAAPIVTDEGLRQLLLRILAGETADMMTPSEAMRGFAWYASVLASLENLWLSVDQGILDPEVLDVQHDDPTLRTEFFRQIWQEVRSMYLPGFAEWVDTLVSGA